MFKRTWLVLKISHSSYLLNSGYEQYGYCQAGTSGLLLSDDTALIGTPGPFKWQGTVYAFSVADDYLERDKNLYYSPLEREAPVDAYSYLGNPNILLCCCWSTVLLSYY